MASADLAGTVEGIQVDIAGHSERISADSSSEELDTSWAASYWASFQEVPSADH
jgi:hypothetical protein